MLYKGREKEYKRQYYLDNKEHLLALARKYYRNHREKKLASSKKWCIRNKEKRREYHKKLKLEVLSYYGGKPPKCACCGEKHIEFLTIDHMNKNGKEDRAKHGGGGGGLYRWLKRNGFPEGLGLRVLCLNCNFALGHYSYCPHEKENKNVE